MSRLKFSKEVKEKIAFAEKQGFKLSRWKKHVVMVNSSGKQVVFSMTSSDQRSVENFKRDVIKISKE